MHVVALKGWLRIERGVCVEPFGVWRKACAKKRVRFVNQGVFPRSRCPHVKYGD